MRFKATLSTSPPRPLALKEASKADWERTRAWFATTMSARREARMDFSTKQVR
jgi:hypothetical protein